MPYLVYLAIFVVTVFGVVLELDALVEPARRIERAALTVTQPGLPASQPAQQIDDVDSRAAGAVPATPGKAANPAAELCDVNACAMAYRSFRATDCTYQPNFGPRRLCDKGKSPQ